MESGSLPWAGLEALARRPPPARPPLGGASFRERVEDFQVDELLGFTPEGAGGHLLLRLRRRDLTTEETARRLVAWAGLPPKGGSRELGWAGLKDRRAVAAQWFSLPWPEDRPLPAPAELEPLGLELLEAVRHRRKLRRGALAGNRFRILLRGVAASREALEERLQDLARGGFPNYFGEQRFGRANLQRAAALLLEGRPVRDRFRRGLYLSAARAALFNAVLARRVEAEAWGRLLPGDVLMPEGSRGRFRDDGSDGALARRVAAGELHPAGPLWGRGGLRPAAEAGALEEAALAPWRSWREALERAGLDRDLRPFRALPRELAWEWPAPGELLLSFRLPRGAFATALLRELVALRGPERP